MTGEKLPLNHVFTFPAGEKLYTYRDDDLTRISSRYYRAIQECINYITTFGVTKEQWKSATALMKERIEKALEDGTHIKCLMDINTSIDYFDKMIAENRNANQVLLEEMYCMFFVLEGETETGFNEVYNNKKKELLKSLSEVEQDFFFEAVRKGLESLGITLDVDTPMQVVRLLRVEAEQKALMMYLNLQEA